MTRSASRYLILLVLSVTSVSISIFFNHTRDCCTTELSGFPFQFYYTDYGCSKGSLPIILPIFIMDMIFHLVFWATMELLVVRMPMRIVRSFKPELNNLLKD